MVFQLKPNRITAQLCSFPTALNGSWTQWTSQVLGDNPNTLGITEMQNLWFAVFIEFTYIHLDTSLVSLQTK